MEKKQTVRTQGKIDTLIKEEMDFLKLQIKRTEEDLVSLMTRLQADLEETKKKISMGHIPSSLGVVQGTGAEIDRLCAKLASQTERLNTFRRILGSK